MAEVVRAELHLEAIRGVRLGYRHHAGVVHEHVETGDHRVDLLGRGAHGAEVGQIEAHHLGLGPGRLGGHVIACDLRLGLVAAPEEHPRALGGQRFGAS